LKRLIKYIGLGGELDMSSSSIFYAEHNFFTRQYKYSISPLLNGRGGKLDRFYHDSSEYSLTLNVVGQTEEQAHELLNGMTKMFERDVFAQTPGKLYINDEYINCYVVSSVATERTHLGNMFTVTLSVLAEQPIWVTEERYDFLTFTDGSETGFKLPTAFPFGFTADKGSRQLIVDHYTSCPMQIAIFGPSSNPEFIVGEHTYRVNGTLLAGERYVIDQRNKTVVKVTNSGEVVNAFNMRNKTESVFEPIQSGENIVSYNGDFAIGITVFYERSEPQWN
jgi:hypothetical protein